MFYDYSHIYGLHEQLIADLQQAINGEYSAINCYEKLARLASSEEERKQILEIRQDEVRHFHQFVHAFSTFSSPKPQYKIVEECPNNYLKGLEFALKDEQKTVDFYLDIADRSSNFYIKEMFQRAAADEQNHAVWFLYYFTKNK